MFDPITIGAALLPTLNYIITKATDHLTGGPKPSTAKEQISIIEAEAKKLEALANLDRAESASYWVQNIRALMRPVAAGIVMFTWTIYVFQVGIVSSDMMNMASAVMFYLFGERIQMKIEKRH